MILDEKKKWVVEQLINKELEPYGITARDIKLGKHGPDWYSKFTTTTENELKFKSWAIDLVKKTFRWNKNLCEKEVNWFIACYGLRVEDNKHATN